MSLYAEYLKERTIKQILETDDGFAVFYYPENMPGVVYLEDVYVKPSARGQKVASALADKVAKEAEEFGCQYMLGSVCANAKNATAGLKAILAYGMELENVQDMMIFFKKKLGAK